jgi:serine/threonine protein kinase
MEEEEKSRIGWEGNTAAETEPSRPNSAISDVVLAESETGAAPTFRMPAPPPVPAATGKRSAIGDKPMALLPGAKVDDFEIVKLLGRGAFGHVYLARQISLDRQVALKISANRGSEGRTMARLEHQHIVQVFAEKVDPDFDQRLLCMQLVPGIGLDKLILLLHFGVANPSNVPREWTGAELLATIDRGVLLPAALDPSALHDREALSRMDDVEATAWFGGRLAEALDFAHRHGVLHRDIKPANILVNPYGRPMLADFNISSQPVGSEPGGEELFGGTFVYMSPEHLDAFNPSHPAGHDAVTARSDMYSLGLVLQQLLEGRMQFATPERKTNVAETLQTMSLDRRRGQPACRAGLPGARKTLERTIGRCLEPEPKDRFSSGAELAEQLDGCRQLRHAERQLPRLPKAFSRVFHRPFFWLVLLVLLPQIAGSVVNIVYNMTQIVKISDDTTRHLEQVPPGQQRVVNMPDSARPTPQLSSDQRERFEQLVIAYNAIVYPLAVVLFVRAVYPIWRCWNALSGTEALTDGEVEAARGQALRLPWWVAVLTALGWFPGGLLFPLVIHLVESPVPFKIWAHFVASFWISGLIALAYSLCGVEFIVLRVLYPGMWRNVRGFTDVARRELAPITKQLGHVQLLAGSIPLVAAVVMLGLGDTTNFRLLVTGLILLGMAGFHVASVVTRELTQVVVTLTGAKS